MTTKRADTISHYHVQLTARNTRNGFPYFPHHESVSALWSQKWRQLCAHGIYPFTDGNVQDFDPIFTDLIQVSNDVPAILYRPDEYAQPFFAAAPQLVADAEQALVQDDSARARDLFLRAAAVYRIARFPINRSAHSQEAWEKGKAAYEQGGRLLDPPSVAVEIPFGHAAPSAGDKDVPIQAYLRSPTGAMPRDGWPVLLFICGARCLPDRPHSPNPDARRPRLRNHQLRDSRHRRLPGGARRPDLA